MRSSRSVVAGFVALLWSPFALACATPGAPLAGSTFTTTVTADEAAQEPAAAGTWNLSFGRDLSFTLSGRQGLAVRGDYVVHAKRITLTDRSGPAVCDSTSATYKWSLARRMLTLTPVDDACARRVAVLATHPLALTGS